MVLWFQLLHLELWATVKYPNLLRAVQLGSSFALCVVTRVFTTLFYSAVWLHSTLTTSCRDFISNHSPSFLPSFPVLSLGPFHVVLMTVALSKFLNKEYEYSCFIFSRTVFGFPESFESPYEFGVILLFTSEKKNASGIFVGIPWSQ